MPALPQIITNSAPRKTPQVRRAGSSALCGAGPGGTIPGASAFRSAISSLRTKEASTTVFVAPLKPLVLDPCFFSYDALLRRRRGSGLDDVRVIVVPILASNHPKGPPPVHTDGDTTL